MKFDKSFFLAGIKKKAEELSLDDQSKQFILKKASIFDTRDSIDSVMGTDPSKANYGALAGHVGQYASGGALAGMATGEGLAHLFTRDKNNLKRNGMIGAGTGALLGGASAGVNDLYRLADNSKTLNIRQLQDEMYLNPALTQANTEEIARIENSPWYEAYGF